MSIQTKITASDNESGFTTLQYAWSTNQKVQPTEWETFTNGQTVTKTNCTDTNYYLWVKVVDKAGNIANNIRVSNAFSVYSIQLKSGPNKTEYENGENVDYTGITIVKHNDVLGDEVINNSLYTISNTRNDDIANNIRYKITVSYEGYSWNIDTYKKAWYGIPGGTYYYYRDHQKVTGMQDLYFKGADGREFTNKYYFNSNGTMFTGWMQNSDGTYYYFLETEPRNEWSNAENADELIAKGFPRGAMIKSNWAKVKSAGTSTYYWYYFNANGIMLTGWQQIGGSWYFLRQTANQFGTGPEGSMLANTSAYINGKTYYFNASGVCTNP